MLRYSLTVLLSAFLLFQVQPLIGKYILPWFGGGPAVWTSCMLFFQTMLLGGYLYAHVMSTQLALRRQAVLHTLVLLGTLVLLPIEPSAAWKPAEAGQPVVQILVLLLITVGGPYFVLSSTGPLLQRWFSWSFPGRSPYRLYALSNAGSLLALISYPFLFESLLRLHDQVLLWSIGYAVFALGIVWCVWRIFQTALITEVDTQMVKPEVDTLSTARRPSILRMALWISLAACGSVSLLATTNQLCMDVAPVPFLWIAPLSAYLLTFILCFDSPRWYDRRVFGTLLAGAAIVGCGLIQQALDVPVPAQIAIYLMVMFACCMACHGELVRSRPDPKYLTLFYLLISLGGALGGVFTAIAAPVWFNGFWEYHIALAASCMLTGIAWCADRAWARLPPLGDQPLSGESRMSPATLPFWIGVAVSGVQVWVALKRVYLPNANEFWPWEHSALLGVFGVIQLLTWGRTVWCGNQPWRLAWSWLNAGAIQLLWMIAFMHMQHPGLLSTVDYLWLAAWLLGSSLTGIVVMLLASLWIGPRSSLAILVSGLQIVAAGTVGLGIYTEQISVQQALTMAGIYLALQFLGWLLMRFLRQGYFRGGVWFWSPTAVLLTMLCFYLYQNVQRENEGVEYASRNFYGVLQVTRVEDYLGDQFSLSHGQIEHGFQYTDEFMRYEPTSYYGYHSGIGLALTLHPRRLAGETLNVGVVGLGVGTTAAYGKQGDHFCFYEINAEVERLSDMYFTYLKDCQAGKEVLIGDARIMMERELAHGRRRGFDVLAVDAFSSDAIPVHLLTAECADIYRQHLKPDGILALHISNRYLDLNPICRALAEHLGWKAIRIDTEDEEESGCYGATWILLTTNSEFLNQPMVAEAHWPWDEDEPAPLLWTDDFASLWQVLQ